VLQLASTGSYTNEVSNLLNILLLALFIASTVLMLASGARRKKVGKRKVYTRIKCFNCGYTIERVYQKGDYVGRVVGKCPRCGGELVVSAVYEVRPEEREEEAKLLRLVERRPQ